MNWQTMNAQEALEKLDVSQEKGLTYGQIIKREYKYGKNTLFEARPKSFLKKFLGQLSDFMIITLLVAAAISFFMALVNENTSYVDSIIILVIVVINGIIGVIQENKAEEAINMLKKLSAPQAKVIRNGKRQKIPGENLVPGDIIVLYTGDLVCADARIIESHNLCVQESSLTGEAQPQKKNARLVFKDTTPIADQKNMLFSSGTIVAGNAVAVVVATGMNTQVGKIAELISENEPPQTPLQNQLAKAGKVISFAILLLCALIFVLGLVQKQNLLEMFTVSISLAVSAIPEGLATVVTLVLAAGVRKMAARNAIIRNLPAVETLGNASVICADKTGTLTQNKMTVTEIRSTLGREPMNSRISDEILTLASLCNNSKVDSKLNILGLPTENALICAAIKHGKNKNELEKQYPRVKEIPFESSKKYMATVHKTPENKHLIIVKGAPDVLLKMCSHYKTGESITEMTLDITKKIQKNNNDMAQKAFRVLAIAYKIVNNICNNTVNNNLIFCGLIGLIDPPRPEAKLAVKKCKDAGIMPVMITGDHVLTAKAIATELGILHGNLRTITGEELDKLDQKEFEKNIFMYSVFARVSPEHKAKIVKAFQSNGAVVAMTGDGVNDAPALKISDIGCAMGITGTDVAKSAADMIMTDDNFATIVEAIRQGRGIFENIRKSIYYLLSTNVGEIVVFLIAFLLRMPTPLYAIHLLWINMVTDTFPALALGMEPIDKNIMKRKPISSEKSLFAGSMGYNIIIEGCFIGLVTLVAFTIGKVFFDKFGELTIARTMAFATLGLSQIIHSFNVKSKKSLLKTNLLDNMALIYSFFLCTFLQIAVLIIPSLQIVFKTKPLGFLEWLIVGILSFLPLIITELEKLLQKTFAHKKLF